MQLQVVAGAIRLLQPLLAGGDMWGLPIVLAVTAER
jgi:hypothetical protein